MSEGACYAVAAAVGGAFCLACGLVLWFAFPPLLLAAVLAGVQVGLGSAVLVALAVSYRCEIRLTLVKTIAKLRS
jgi:hypothetical protein